MLAIIILIISLGLSNGVMIPRQTTKITNDAGIFVIQEDHRVALQYIVDLADVIGYVGSSLSQRN